MRKMLMMCAVAMVATLCAWAEYTDDCITFSSAASFTLKTANTSKNWDGKLWTSTDKLNWTEWKGSEVSAAQTGGTYKLYVRGDASNTMITGYYDHEWVLTGSDVACTGNIETLRGARGNDPSPTKMADFCYRVMFYGCTALEEAPALPATTLAMGCYWDMFSGCTALTNAPALPATTLVFGCYEGMFRDCTSLEVNTTAPGKEWKILATAGASDWGTDMFTGTKGTLRGQPALNTTYYIASAVTDDCITFSSAEAFTLKTENTGVNWDGTLWTSTDKANWTEWKGAEVSAAKTGGTYDLYVRGNMSNTKITGFGSRWVLTGSAGIACTGNIETLRGATGDQPSPTSMEASCYEDMFRGCTLLTCAPALPATMLADYCYYRMFEDCASLEEAPALPATTLADSCYFKMFSGCTALKDAPALPATTLALSCYLGMFDGCTALTDVPALPAMMLANTCYLGMFYGCTALKVNKAAPGKEWKIPATSTTVTNWGKDMFKGAGGTLQGQPELNTTYYIKSALPPPEPIDDCITFSSGNAFTLKTYNGAKNWDGTLWTSTDKANWTEWDGTEVSAAKTGGTYKLYVRGNTSNTKITDGYSYRWVLTGSNIACTGNIETLRGATGNNPSQTKMGGCCYSGMFWECASLEEAPELPATTLSEGCYSFMFWGCTALTNAPALPATTLTDKCYDGMFCVCRSLTSAPALQAMVLTSECYAGMFCGCRALTNAPALPATTLADKCYEEMFCGCTSLTNAPALPATTLAEYCYYGMFWDCTSLKEAPVLPATTLSYCCYLQMFSGCMALTNAPALPATTLAEACYWGMFSGCTSLTNAPALPATTLAGWCYNSMFSGCTLLEVNEKGPGKEWKIPAISTTATNWGVDMFKGTGGTLQGQPALNTTYYIKSASPPNNCITFSSAESFTLKTYNAAKNWDGTLWTSIDKTNWTEWNGTEVSAAKTGGTYNLYVRGDVNNTKITGFSQSYRWVFNGSNIACSGNIETLRGATGNNPSPTKMANYCYYGMFDSCKALTTAPALPATTLADYCYSVMFAGCTSLTDAPALPATTLANGCYNAMFVRCVELKKAPALPATTLADFCYHVMFAHCDSLTEVPALPATTLALACYSSMFFGCTSLTNAPALAATTLAEACYSSMFFGCTSLTAAPVLPATTLASRCYQWMFDSCTALTSAPELPATTLSDECYKNMFEGCTALTTAPALPATTLTDSCYSNMFYGCTALEVNTAAPGKEWKIPAISTTATNWGVDMFKGTGGTLQGQPELNTTYYIKSALPPPIDDCITFSSAEAFTLKTYNTAKNWDGMLWTSTDKTNWTEWNGTEVSAAKTGGAYNLYVRGNENNTVITGFHPDYEYHQYRWVLTGSAGIACTGNIETLRGAEGEDPSPKEMAFYCYYSMFYGCTALTSAPALPATTLMGGCYSDMFYGCTSLTNAPALPATELWDQCYYDMFRGCTSLTNAPALPATMAAQYCYSYMFYGCTSLTNAPALPATTLDWYCYEYMFYGCTSLTDAPALPATTLAKDCYNSMFYGCTSLTTAPALPATMLADYCYYRMFEDCASLEVNAEAPGKEWKIPATSTTVSSWGYNMFYGTKGTLQGQPELNTTYYIKSAPPELAITDVKAQQRYPWNGKVDISYTVENAGTETRELYVRAVDQLAGITNVARSVTGDTAYTSGKHHIVWDMAADGLMLVSTSVVFAVSYVEPPPLYCVIDLSSGASAISYSVTYLYAVPPGGWLDEYKTTKFVLRRIEPGTCVVTLDKPCYLGVFAVTQKQYALVTGAMPSRFSGDKRPVECVSYNTIRGADRGSQYPSSTDVDADSFMGRLRARTGLHFDLPTDTQLEYACRAGTTTQYSYGDSVNGDYMWYCDNSGSCSHDVGTRRPNGWGLYDVHGNVWEWCLDWYPGYVGSYRTIRGGSWYNTPGHSCSAYRGGYHPSYANSHVGFRLARVLPNTEKTETCGGTSAQGVSDPVRIDLTPGTRTAAKTEVLTYSTEWGGDIADAVAVVSVNGDVISEQSGSGTVEWTPSRGGANVLTHVIMQDGVPVGETLTATFNVNGGPYKEIIDGVEWTYMAQDGKATLGGGSPEDPTAVPTSTAGALMVPSTIGGCTVDSIAEHAFQDCDKLTAITISEGVVRIGAAAFAGCDSLNAVDFECAPPEGIGNVSIRQDVAIRYNVRYETQWLSVIAQCGWTNAAPYDPHHRYTTSRVISVNICGGAAADKATDAAGLVPVPVSAWNNYQTVNRDYSGITWNGSRTVTLEDNWTVRPSGKTVWYWVPSGMESILRCYVDDNDSIYSTMIFSDIPFARYDVYVYMAADTNAKFNPVSLTADGASTTYMCGERGIGVAGETKWGQSQERASRAGQNTIVIRGQNARNLTISGGPRGATRGAIAAVQLVEAGDSPVYRATMSEDTEWQSLKWEPAVPEGGFERGARLDLTVVGSPTLSFDEVVAPNCELTIHGTPCIKMSDGLYEDGCWQRNFATFDVLVTTDAVSFAPVKDGFSGAYAQSICGFSLRAQNKEVISINFAHGIDRAVSGTNYTGLAPVQGNTWANMTETWSRNGKTVKLPPLRVTIDGATINYRPEISGSCYAANTYCWDTARDVFLKGYLDDGLNQAQVTVTNIPYSKYDVIVYCVTDTDNLAFRAVTVNGTAYTYDSEDPCVAKVGSDNWGASRGVVAEYGRNAIRVCGQTSSTLTIKGGTNGDGARGGIAAIQIVCTGNADPLYWDYTVGVNDCGKVEIPDGVDPNRIRLYDPLGNPVEITERDENFVYYEWNVTGVICWWDYEFNQRGGEHPVNTGRDNVSLVLDGIRDPIIKNKEYVTNDITGEISIRAAAYPYRSVNRWTDVLTVVTYGTSVRSTNAYVMCVGNKTSGCLFLATGNDSARTLELCYSDRGNTPKVLGAFDVPASVDDRHLYILSVNSDLDGNTIVAINVDGRALYKYVHSGALAIGGGFQIAGIHGSDYGGRYRPTADDPAILDWVRVYDVGLADETIRKYVERCPSAPVPPQISPESGTTFGTSLTVSISCESEDAPVHYTLDGSDPTMESPVYSKKFRISSRTVVKAIAFREDGTASDMAVAEYAPGRCDDPMITPKDGTEFEHSGLSVSIRRTAEDGVLRYTIDGSDPTEESPEYAGPFTIDESTVVKAKAFGDQYFDSNIVTATLTRVWVKLATPVITADETFTGTKNKVVMACANEGATIYYTLDGSEPTTSSLVYSKPFCVTEGCTIKAKAVQYDYTDSEVAEKEITREWGIGQTMGKPDHSFETSGDAGFVRVVDATAALGESMQSGEIKNSQTSILSTVVVGPGKFSFKWKTSCEDDPPLHEWDHAEFVLDGNILEVLDGETEWQSVSCDITGDGPHTVIWRYVKDGSEFEGEDCLWVSEYVWESDYTETQTTGVPVPYLWLEEKCSDVVDEFESYEKVAKQRALNKRLTVEQCYVAGVDPESLMQDFTTTITMEGGFPKIVWDPDLGILREYKVWGRESLMGGDWVCPTNSTHRFFKVTVEMP